MSGAVVRPNNGPGSSGDRSIAFSAAEMSRMIDRMAHQVLEKTGGGLGVTLMGIPTRGVPLARRLAERMMAFEPVHIPVGALDTTLYRDDLRRRAIRPLAETVEPPGGVEGQLVVLVDDVLCSGRTVRAALDALRDLGRPRAVQLAVLIDRGHRELPIRADYVGKNVPTAPSQKVYVAFDESDGWDGIEIAAAPSGESGSHMTGGV